MPYCMKRGSTNGRVFEEGTTKTPLLPLGLAPVGSKLTNRSLASVNGESSSYRRPKLRVSLELTRNSSCAKKPFSQFVTSIGGGNIFFTTTRSGGGRPTHR